MSGTNTVTGAGASTVASTVTGAGSGQVHPATILTAMSALMRSMWTAIHTDSAELKEQVVKDFDALEDMVATASVQPTRAYAATTSTSPTYPTIAGAASSTVAGAGLGSSTVTGSGSSTVAGAVHIPATADEAEHSSDLS